MVEIPLQLQRDHKTLAVMSQDDADRLKEFHPNQILRAKITGVKKPRSVIQLNLYWACCQTVADNLDGVTKEEVDFDVRVALRFIKRLKVSAGITYVEPHSISFANLQHIEACNYFDRAFPAMAKMIGISADELLNGVNMAP